MRRLLPMAHDETVVAGSFTISGTARQNMTCFTSSEMETSAAAELNQKFYDLIIPSRPAFWYHIGDNLSYLDADPTVPRIHYEEIVCPMNYFEIPPNF